MAAVIAVLTSWRLNQPRSLGPDARESSRPRPPSDRKLISFKRADERRPLADRLLHLDRGQREIGEPLGEVGRGLVDMIGRAVVEQVPDDLDARPARPLPAPAASSTSRICPAIVSIRCQRRPSRTVRKPSSLALPIVLQHVPVVAGRPDQVEANAVPPPMRRAFETRLEEAGERRATH